VAPAGNSSRISNIYLEDSQEAEEIEVEHNQVEFELIERMPHQLIGRPSYQFLMDELQKQPWYERDRSRIHRIY